VKLITNFTNHIKELGPLGQHEGITSEELNFKLLAAKAAVKSIRLRTQLSKLVQNMREHDDYSFQAIEAKISEKLNAVIMVEIEKQERAIVESSAHNAE
jgi:hypothetical protein